MSTHATPVDTRAINDLEERFRGTVLRPPDEDYDAARAVWNGLIDTRPAIVARCQGAADVANCLTFAQDHALPVSIRGGGHHQSGSALVEDGLVLDLSEMTSVHVDTDARTVRVEPGGRVRDVLIETQHYGLATPTGSAGDVGIAGSTLGGGIGWIRRKHGLGIDALRSVDVVTSDGTLVRASPDQHEDLFWAVRGGGGNFGIITSFEFECYEVGPIVAGLGVFYPGDVAEEVLEAYADLTHETSDEVTTLALYGHVPPLPPIPDDLAGQHAVAIMGCSLGDIEEGQEALQPFRTISEPLLDMSEPMPYLLLHQLGTMMFPEGRRYCHRSAFVDTLSKSLINLVIEHAGDAPSSLSGIGVWHLGGAIATVGNDETAFPYRDKHYMVITEANWEADSDDTENLEWARETDDRLRELGGVGAYGGFTGVSERAGEEFRDRVYGDNVERLAHIKATYDASNALTQNINIDPAAD